MYQIGLIFGVVILAPKYSIFGLAWGVLVGASLHFVLQIPTLLKQGGRYFPSLGIRNPHVQEVMRLMAPRLLGVAVVQLNFWVNTRLASQQPEGSVTGIVVAFTLMLMPQAAIAQSIAIAAMPTLSAQYALDKMNELRNSFASSLRGVLLLSLPASLGLILLRKPLVELIYQRGEFNARSTELVAWALLWYAAGLVAHSVVEIVARAFYALHDTKTPVLVGAGAMSLNIMFSFLFVALFTRLGWLPHGGLALANSLATTLEMIGLLYLMRRRLGGINGSYILTGGMQAALATVAMSAVIWYWLQQTVQFPVWLVGGGGVTLGGLVFLLAALVLGVSEVRRALQTVRARLTG